MVKQDTGVVGVSGRMKRLMEVDDLIWQPLKVSAETIRSSSCSNSDNNSKKKKNYAGRMQQDTIKETNSTDLL